MEKHKNFIFFLGATVLILVLYAVVILLPLCNEVAQTRSRISSIETSLIEKTQTGVRDSRSIRMAKESGLALLSDIEKLSKNLETTLAPAYLTPSIKSLGLDFDTKRRAVQSELTSRASEKGISFPKSIGFKEGFPEESEVPHLLIKLGAIERIANLAIEAGVSAVRYIGPGTAPSYQEEPLEHDAFYREDRPAPSAVTASKSIPQRQRAHLQTLPICTVLEGSANSISRMLSGLLTREKFLLLSQAEIVNTKPETGTIEAFFVFEAVRISEAIAREVKPLITEETR